MKNMPERIHLQIDPENEKPEQFDDRSGLTWCPDRVNSTDVEYLRYSGINDSRGEPINLNDNVRVKVRSYKDQKPIAVFDSIVRLIDGKFCVNSPNGEWTWIGGFGRYCTLEVMNGID